MSQITELKSEDRLNKVKGGLEGFRELIVRADSILETDHYTTVAATGLTLAFSFIWMWDPSLLTLLAFIGTLATLIDYAGPKILNWVFNPNDWNETKATKFNNACEEFVRLIDMGENAFVSYKELRTKKPFLHFVFTVAFLLTVAWVGNRINNLLLVYLLAIAAIMLPGLHRRGMLQKAWVIIEFQVEHLSKRISEFAKEKYGLIKTE